MKTLNRRSMLRGALSTVCALPLASALPHLAHAIGPSGGGCGCCQLRWGAYAASAGDVTSVKIAKSSGDAETDRFLGSALGRLASTFKISPGFAFFDDAASPNAMALPDTLLDKGPGTVLMGMHLFGQLMARVRDGGITVIAVCAHEFAHIHQMHGSYQKELVGLDKTHKPLELHADFLAGFYIALRKAEHPELDLHAVGGVLYALGDRNFGSRRHHGTPEQRFAALSAGLDFGTKGGRDITEAASAGLSFVRRNG